MKPLTPWKAKSPPGFPMHWPKPAEKGLARLRGYKKVKGKKSFNN